MDADAEEGGRGVSFEGESIGGRSWSGVGTSSGEELWSATILISGGLDGLFEVRRLESLETREGVDEDAEDAEETDSEGEPADELS